MSNSSQQQNLSNDLINITDYSYDVGTITIDLGSSNNVYVDSTNMNSTYTIAGSGVSDTITLNSNYQFNWGAAEEFIDSFPDWQRVQAMCEKYPGLEIALRNFRTVYTLVKDDYDNPKDKE